MSPESGIDQLWGEGGTFFGKKRGVPEDVLWVSKYYFSVFSTFC